MAKPFDELRERLLRAGVAPRHVRRYLTELADHLTDLRAEEELAGRSRADAEAAGLIRLGGMDELSMAMIDQRRFQSWCVRAPRAKFGLAPLFVLAGAYFVAGLILLSGWKLFLPGTNSPFVQINGFAIFYFGVGRLLYFGAPILIGWGIGLVAVRQRFMTVWPAIGLVLIALIGGMAHVYASRPAVLGGVGNIGMEFTIGPSVQDVSHHLFQALVILSLTVLPCLIWRLQKVHSLSA
jgi:hypothetical protein